MNRYVLQLQFLAAAGGLLLAAVVFLVLRAGFRDGFHAFNAIQALFLGCLLLLCLTFVLRGQDDRTRATLRTASRAGLYTGAAAFLLGFVGPLVVTPDASCGPLLGIFFTGPLGFVVGVAVALGVLAVTRSRSIADS